jgi:hypothetical protein
MVVVARFGVVCESHPLREVQSTHINHPYSSGVLSGKLRQHSHVHAIVSGQSLSPHPITGTMIYLFRVGDVHVVGNVHPRTTHPGAELVGMYKKIQDALAAAKKMNIEVVSLVRRAWSGLTPEGRERLRASKLGLNNPNAAGLSEMHKRKIAEKMKYRRGEHHHFYNFRHTPTGKLKISLGMKKLSPRRWVLSPEGTEHFVYLPFTLPVGWCWGRKRAG